MRRNLPRPSVVQFHLRTLQEFPCREAAYVRDDRFVRSRENPGLESEECKWLFSRGCIDPQLIHLLTCYNQVVTHAPKPLVALGQCRQDFRYSACPTIQRVLSLSVLLTSGCGRDFPWTLCVLPFASSWPCWCLSCRVLFKVTMFILDSSRPLVWYKRLLNWQCCPPLRAHENPAHA